MCICRGIGSWCSCSKDFVFVTLNGYLDWSRTPYSQNVQWKLDLWHFPLPLGLSFLCLVSQASGIFDTRGPLWAQSLLKSLPAGLLDILSLEVTSAFLVTVWLCSASSLELSHPFLKGCPKAVLKLFLLASLISHHLLKTLFEKRKFLP